MDKEDIKEKYEKRIVVPLSLEMWKTLRKTSYEQELSMNHLVRDALEKALKKATKGVDSK